MRNIFVICFVINFINNYNCNNASVSIEKNHARSFFFLPPIIPLDSFTKRRRQRPQKQTCIGDCGLQGICSTKSDCTSASGTPSGLCSDNSVCCINYRKCGSNSTAELTYFVNPGFPDVYSGGSQCSLKIVKSGPQICQLRIDFKEFSLVQPSNEGFCVNDFFTITACSNYKFCGENKNQHVYVDFNESSDFLTFSIDTNSAVKTTRFWNMEIKQISCDSHLRAPSGCLMYYTGTSGTVTSFNYGEPKLNQMKINRQIRGLNYGVCVQWKSEYCSIEWSKDADSYSFSISGNSSLIMDGNPETLGLQGPSCQNSFIVIPNSYRNNEPLYEERFCGSFFSTTKTSSKPYVLYVVMGQDETLNSEDEGNRGFKLNFRQLPCSN